VRAPPARPLHRWGQSDDEEDDDEDDAAVLLDEELDEPESEEDVPEGVDAGVEDEDALRLSVR
jgi:hypothetical protein